MRLDQDKLKQSGFLLGLCAIALILFWFLKMFLSAFLGAIIFYILLRKPLFYFEKKFPRWGIRYAAIAGLMLLSFLVLVLPVLLVTFMLSGKVNYLISHYEDILRIALEASRQVQDYFNVDILSGDAIAKLSSFAAQVLPGFLSATAGAVADIFVLYFLLYFMLVNATGFEKTVREYMPFKDENDQLLLSELKSQTLSNAIGIPILATLQGLIAWLGYWIFDMKEPFFWGVITGLMSVLPVVGTAVVWVPISIYLYASGFHWQGLALALYGAVIITNIDNVFRFVVQKQIGDIHPLVTFFGVILGLQLFGFVGIIFGPLLISYFILLLKIYRKEYL